MGIYAESFSSCQPSRNTLFCRMGEITILAVSPVSFSDVHNTAMANKYFPLSDYKQKSYWGGSADGKTLDNYYINLRSGDTDWLVLNLEFGPSDEALQWADS